MIYASMRDCGFSNSSPKPAGLLASVLQAASLTSDCSRPPVAGTRRDEYSHGPVFPGIGAPEKTVGEERQRLGCPEAPAPSAAAIDRWYHAARCRVWYPACASAVLLSRRYPAAQQSPCADWPTFTCTGIRDNFMTGKVIMPDEEYLQSWWYGVPLGTSETHSDRMECTACRRRVLVVALRHRREGFARAGTAGARSSVLLP